MFPETVYTNRRKKLKDQIGSGLVILLGNRLSPMNYKDNPFPFRQDSTFLYYFGLDSPDLAGIIDIDNDLDVILGSDLTPEENVWTKAQPALIERAHAVGITKTKETAQLDEVLKKALTKERLIHLLPPYRDEHVLNIHRLTGISPAQVEQSVSKDLIKAVVTQRSYKSSEEVQQIEKALETTYLMHAEAMKLTKPGIYERDIAAAMECIAHKNGEGLSYPIIFTTEGQILHNNYYDNLIADGDLIVNDAGAESAMHYAGDITRTFPANGIFSERQKQLYNIVLKAQQNAIDAIKPGIEYREIHLMACEIIASGLKDIGVLKGNVKEIVNAGAHALFFPHGLGHMLGLDVHDMENLGEDRVGYTETTKRSSQFGLRFLRLSKKLETGFVLTVEPGIYFIPQLIDKWKADKKHTEFINYDKAEKFKDFGGIRIEDNVLVTNTGYRVLGKPIPKSVEEVEKVYSQ